MTWRAGTGGRKARPYATARTRGVVLIGVMAGVAWAGPRVTMESGRIETGARLARGTSAQVEAGEIAAWAGNLPPDPPAGLFIMSGGDKPRPYAEGEVGTSSTVALGFALSDPDPGDKVRYVVEVSTGAEFRVIVASTAGRPEGRPLRTTTIGPLSEGWYWWRVKAVDAMGVESSWSVANEGEAAFGVDDDPPGAVVSTPTAGATVRVGEAITIAGEVSGADVAGWEIVVSTDGRPGGRPYASGTNRQVSVRWIPMGEAGTVTIALTARDAEGFRNTARVEVVVSTAGRPEGRPLRTAPGMEAEAFGFRSAGVGPNPARAGALVSGHLAVGRADAMRARLFTNAGELVANEDASNPVWHAASGGQEPAPARSELCYEPAVDTRGLASGVYLLVMEAEKEGQPPVRVVRKLLIIK